MLSEQQYRQGGNVLALLKLSQRDLQRMRIDSEHFALAAVVYWLHHEKKVQIPTAIKRVAEEGVVLANGRRIFKDAITVRRVWRQFRGHDFSGISVSE